MDGLDTISAILRDYFVPPWVEGIDSINRIQEQDMNTKILSALKRGPKAGLTVAALAERTGFKLSSVRTAIQTLKGEGQVTVAGSVKPSGVGRPATLYTIA